MVMTAPGMSDSWLPIMICGGSWTSQPQTVPGLVHDQLGKWRVAQHTGHRIVEIMCGQVGAADLPAQPVGRQHRPRRWRHVRRSHGR